MRMNLRIVAPALAFALLASSACGCLRDDRVTIDVPFEARWGAGQARCVDGDTTGFALRDLRFFVHDVRLVAEDGRAVVTDMVPDGIFQTARVALLDFENGRGSCAGGTARTHTHVRVRAPRGSYTGIRFRVGVPFAENHADAALAEGPLTAGTLHWGWRGGYKFVRFEASSGESTYRVHLGSTGCEGAIARITRCGRANRPRVALSGFWPRRVVALHLDRLAEAAGADCMGTTDGDCRPAFASLGLDLTTGANARDAEAFTWGAP